VSGLNRPDARYQPDVEQGLSAIAGQILGHDSATIRNVPFRRAVLQHYGVRTHYVDITADAEIAAWFATNRSHPRTAIWAGAPLRRLEQTEYVTREEGLGYIVVLAIPDADALKTARVLFDISTLDPFLRPQRQKAWLIAQRPPLQPDPNEFWAATIKVDCSQYVSKLSSAYLFPLPDQDEGFKTLLNIPFVELPNEWISQAKEEKAPKFDITFGIRALPVAEYVHCREKDEYNHKWSDMTLTEAKPMQIWKSWEFELSKELPGTMGNIKDAVKITISPQAKKLMYSCGESVPLRWANLGSDELFFTFSQYGHDKVSDIEYPYYGVWLHRDKELILEHPMSADRDTLAVHAGHVFEFIGQDLHLYNLPSSCPCGKPEEHEARVRAMLRLSALLEAEYLIMVPHPCSKYLTGIL